MRRRRLLVAALLSPVAPAAAQTAWPQRPIRFIVPAAPGTGPETLTAATERAAEFWGRIIRERGIVLD